MSTLSTPFDPDRETPPEAALEIHRARVVPEWIDYNGHLNVGYYVVAFDKATDMLLDLFDIGEAHAARARQGCFVLETHVTYVEEVGLNDPLRFTAQMLDADDKRLHFFIEMHHGEEGYLAATSEQIAMLVDLEGRRSVPFPTLAARRIEALTAAHRALPRPLQVGSRIAIRRKG